ncbi:nuclear transport factor 2 family protein [uncultured Microbulbifer sp.]|uniref:nuclear transport factor 2 family protein n=1 Tax=uncultured Microbulbifer sp. TaxID=348147 RepID=UPI00263167E2|nr:nuclear transport factor 2 family protein [uncultured Microbulbifer sp.]
MRAVILCILLVLTAGQSRADDKEELSQLLHHFIENAASSAEVHRRFWAEDLIYTSSAGKRFGKTQIMQGMEVSPDEPVTVRYAAEDVDIRLLGDTAIVAFKLVANDRSNGVKNYYFNTGTFAKRKGDWYVVAWQATQIPNEGKPSEKK